MLLYCGDVRACQQCLYGVTQPLFCQQLQRSESVHVQIITDFYFSCSPPSLSFNASIFIATKTRFFFSVYLVDLLIFTLQSFTKKKLLPRFSNAFTLEIPIFRFLARSLSFNEEASYLHVRFSTKHLMDSNSFSLNNIISR